MNINILLKTPFFQVLPCRHHQKIPIALIPLLTLIDSIPSSSLRRDPHHLHRHKHLYPRCALRGQHGHLAVHFVDGLFKLLFVEPPEEALGESLLVAALVAREQEPADVEQGHDGAHLLKGGHEGLRLVQIGRVLGRIEFKRDLHLGRVWEGLNARVEKFRIGVIEVVDFSLSSAKLRVDEWIPMNH
jgi:hypothetical protein